MRTLFDGDDGSNQAFVHLISIWIIIHWEAALCCMLLTLFTARTIWRNYRRVQQRFQYDENETVDFRDIMEGPAAIQAVPWRGPRNGNNSGKTSPSKYSKTTERIDIEEGIDEWNHPSTHPVKNRRCRSGSPHQLQTI